MDISKFIEENTSYIFSVNSVSIDFVLKNIETGTMFINDFKEKEIPMKVTIFKVLSGFPIQITSAAKMVNGKTCWNIVRGNEDLKNIIKWVTDDVPIVLEDKTIRFSDFNEKDRKWFLEKSSLVSTIIDYGYSCDKKNIPSEYLTEFVLFSS